MKSCEERRHQPAVWLLVLLFLWVGYRGYTALQKFVQEAQHGVWFAVDLGLTIGVLLLLVYAIAKRLTAR